MLLWRPLSGMDINRIWTSSFVGLYEKILSDIVVQTERSEVCTHEQGQDKKSGIYNLFVNCLC